MAFSVSAVYNITKLQERLDDLKDSVTNKEKSDLVNPPATLSYSESKLFTNRYKGFLKECNELSAKIQTLIDDCAEDLSDLNVIKEACGGLIRRLEHLVALSKSTEADIKQRRIEDVKADLARVINDVSAIQAEQELLPETIISSHASKELLEESETAVNALFKRLIDMQTSVKTTCVRVDDVHTDKTLPRPVRKELKSEAVKVLEGYAKVMGTLKQLRDTWKRLHAEKVEEIDRRFSTWREQVDSLDAWLTEKTTTNEDVNIEYGTYTQLKDLNTENRHLIREMGEIWKKFELIAQEWNTGLCDDVNDDNYADVLVEIQAKFARLNVIANKFKTQINDMMNQRKAEDECNTKLESWKSYVDEKTEVIAVHSTDNSRPEALIKDIREKDEDVKAFLQETGVVLKNNTYDEKGVEQTEEKLKEFCDQWDQMKEQCNDIEKRIKEEEEALKTQKETERNLTESLRIWKKFLDGCLSKLDLFDLDENCEPQTISDAIKEVEILISQINNQNNKFIEYERNSTTLIDTLQEENAAQLSSQFQSFFQQWEETKEKGAAILSNLNSIAQRRIENEEKVLEKWKANNMVTEEWLVSVASEIEVYAAPDTDFDDYLAKLDELESKVNGDVSAIDSSIVLGASLTDEGQITLDANKVVIKNDVDVFQTKKATLNESLQLAKSNVAELRDKHLLEKQLQKQLQKQNEDEILANLAEWNKKLQLNKKTFNSTEESVTTSIPDTQKTIDTLTTLLQEMTSSEDDLQIFETNSQQLINTLEVETFDTTQLLLWKFREFWNLCKTDTSERIMCLTKHLDELMNNETFAIGEWDASAKTTIDWLENAESAASILGTGLVDISDIRTSMKKYEELSNKRIDKAVSIAEQKESGAGMIERGNIQLSVNITKINNNIIMFDEKLAAISDNLSNANKLIEDQVRVYVVKKLNDFGAWFPTIHARSEEGDSIGPDVDAVNKQIQEMKVIQGQALQMSFDDVTNDGNDKLLGYLSEEETSNLEAARDEWAYINDWIETRLETLTKCAQIWDDFKMRNVDLTDYLRDVENELNDASAVDLNNNEMVEERGESIQNITAGMETRKHHVANAVELANQLVELIQTESDSESPLAFAIQSEVTDILDLWNCKVKQSIELKTILLDSCKKFSVLEKMFIEVREWVLSVNETLDRFTSDAKGKNFDELRTQLDDKQKEKEEVKRKLDTMVTIDEELTQNGNLATRYSFDGSIAELNADFDTVSSELAQFAKFRGKARMLSRRVRGSTLRLFTKSERTVA